VRIAVANLASACCVLDRRTGNVSARPSRAPGEASAALAARPCRDQERFLARCVESAPWRARRKPPDRLARIEPPSEPTTRHGKRKRWLTWRTGSMSGPASFLSVYGGGSTSRAGHRTMPRIRRRCPHTTRGRVPIGCGGDDRAAGYYSRLLQPGYSCLVLLARASALFLAARSRIEPDPRSRKGSPAEQRRPMSSGEPVLRRCWSARAFRQA
jgi:hypothetical protein